MEMHSCGRFFSLNYYQNAQPNSSWTSFVCVAEDATVCCPDHDPGRDPDWVSLTLQGTMDVIKEGIMIGKVPDVAFA